MIHQMILTSISSNIIYHVAGKLLASPWLPKKLLFSLPTIQAGSKYRHLVKLLPRRTMVMQQLWRFCWPQSAASCIGSQLTVTNHPKSVETKKYTRCIRGVTLFKEAGIIWIKLSQYVRIHEIPSGCRTKVFTKVLSSLVRTLWPPSSKVTSPVTLPARVQLWITTRLAMFDPLIFALRLCRFIHYGNEKNEEKSSGNGWKKTIKPIGTKHQICTKQSSETKSETTVLTVESLYLKDLRIGFSVSNRFSGSFRGERYQLRTRETRPLPYWYHFTFIYI